MKKNKYLLSPDINNPDLTRTIRGYDQENKKIISLEGILINLQEMMDILLMSLIRIVDYNTLLFMLLEN